MSDLEPITRNEKLWSGENLEPKTRREMYIRHLYDETQVIPDSPKTREEMFILKAGEELHDVTIEQLTATENGTYSEEGVAYSPVIVEVPEPTLISKRITANGNYSARADNADGYSSVSVNVPLPSNAYLLQSIEHEQVATFSDGTDNFLKSLEVSIEPQQDLHGYDSPWVGGSGKNKFDIDAEHTRSTSTYLYELIVKPNTAYTMSSNVPQSNPASLYFNGGATDANGVWSGTSKTFTSDENGKLIAYVRYNASQGGVDLYTAVKNGQYYIQLEEGSTATSYAPYSNICPISGWDEVNVTRCGKNLYGGIDFANSVKDASPSGAIDTTNKTVTYSYGTGSKITIFDTFKPLTSYTFLFKVADCGGQNFSMRIVYTDGTTEGIEILPSDIGNYVRKVSDPNKTVSKLAVMWYQSTLVKLYYDECGIFEGNIQTTDFALYQGQTYTLDLDGTRYGGKLDVVNGVLTVDRVNVTVDENSNVISGSGGLPFRIDLLTGAKASSSASALTGVKCNFLKEVTQSSSWGFDGTFSRVTTDAKIVYFKVNSEITTIQQLKTFLQSNNLQFVYELATPQTIQLTPTIIKSLQGENNFFASTGEIETLQYWSREVS